MKLIAGHKYLKGNNGDILPFSEDLFKAAKSASAGSKTVEYDIYIPSKTEFNDRQLEENDVIKSAAPKNVEVAKKEAKEIISGMNKPVSRKFVHHDITKDLLHDLSAAEG